MAKGTKEKPHLGEFITFVLCCFCLTVYNEGKVSLRRCWMPEKRTQRCTKGNIFGFIFWFPESLKFNSIYLFTLIVVT